MKTKEVRYDYIVGCKTREKAQERLEHCYASGEVMQSESPKIQGYFASLQDGTGKKVKRYKVSLKLCDI